MAVLTSIDQGPTQARPTIGPAAAQVPLVVDLDGTLLHGDSMVEAVFAAARRRPSTLLRLPGWLRQGRARVKAALAGAQAIDVATLPFDDELLAQLRAERAHGRHLVLATGADRQLADAVANQLALFDEVIASDGSTNLTAGHKRDLLVSRFGERGFDYAGNSHDDLPVWGAARRGWLIAPRPRLLAAATRLTEIDRVLQRPAASLGMVLGALRIHHWIKNLLLIAPLVAAQRLFDATVLVPALVGMLAFGLAASGIYLLNDLLDLAADRRHPVKRHRALASGALPLSAALAMVPLLWLGAAAIGFVLGPAFVTALAVYVLTMAVYSLGLKDVPLLDAAVLAAGYALRVQAGGLATGVPVAPWLTSCSLALFFGLALLKRYAELVTLRPGLPAEARVRCYRVADAPRIAALGAVACLGAVVLLAVSPLVEAQPPARAVWGVGLLLLAWIVRLWVMAHHGRIHGDPVTFAFHDWPSRALGLATATVLLCVQ